MRPQAQRALVTGIYETLGDDSCRAPGITEASAFSPDSFPHIVVSPDPPGQGPAPFMILVPNNNAYLPTELVKSAPQHRLPSRLESHIV